jgi:protoporphyrinogen oxidase
VCCVVTTNKVQVRHKKPADVRTDQPVGGEIHFDNVVLRHEAPDIQRSRAQQTTR